MSVIARGIAASLLLFLVGCSGVSSFDRTEAEDDGGRPAVILVTTVDDTKGAAAVQASMLTDLVVKALREDGAPAVALSPGKATRDAFLLRLEVADADPGNAWKRMVVGFGWGRSHMALHVSLADLDRRRDLLAFSVLAGSGREPGVAMSLVGTGGGALLLPAVGGGLSAVHLGSLGPGRDARDAANAAVFGVTAYFRRLGWDDWTGSAGSTLGVPAARLDAPRALAE